MRHAPGRATLAAMKIVTPTRRVILEAAVERSVIRGTLTTATSERREFHGWLELNTALEAMLGGRGAPGHDETRGAGR
jgi:hypothetical protein